MDYEDFKIAVISYLNSVGYQNGKFYGMGKYGVDYAEIGEAGKDVFFVEYEGSIINCYTSLNGKGHRNLSIIMTENQICFVAYGADGSGKTLLDVYVKDNPEFGLRVARECLETCGAYLR